MSTTYVYLVKRCAHCGCGCESREHECGDCRFFYCEEHGEPTTHDCEAVCLELRRCEDEACREARGGPRLVLFSGS